MQNNLVENNLGLVKKIASEYMNKTTLEFDDLFQEGVIGLMKASEKFNPELGYAFSTYATYWIRQKIQRAIENSMNVSRNAKKNRGKIYAFRAQLELAGVDATPQLIAENLGLTIEDVLGVLYPESISIYTPLNSDENSDCLADTLVSEYNPIDENIERQDLAEMVRGVIQTLSDNEKNVIYERYFSNPLKISTYEEVSKKLGVSRQRVQQLEKKALSRLKYKKELFSFYNVNK